MQVTISTSKDDAKWRAAQAALNAAAERMRGAEHEWWEASKEWDAARRKLDDIEGQ